MALLTVDLDRFSDINETLGRGAGDKILQQLAGRLSSGLRGKGDHADLRRGLRMAVRVGGDEFALMLTETVGEDFLSGFAERLLQTVSTPFRVDETEVVPDRERRGGGGAGGPDRRRGASAARRDRDVRGPAPGRGPVPHLQRFAERGGGLQAGDGPSAAGGPGARRVLFALPARRRVGGPPGRSGWRRSCGGRTRSTARSPRGLRPGGGGDGPDDDRSGPGSAQCAVVSSSPGSGPGCPRSAWR